MGSVVDADGDGNAAGDDRGQRGEGDQHKWHEAYPRSVAAGGRDDDDRYHPRRQERRRRSGSLSTTIDLSARARRRYHQGTPRIRGWGNEQADRGEHDGHRQCGESRQDVDRWAGFHIILQGSCWLFQHGHTSASPAQPGPAQTAIPGRRSNPPPDHNESQDEDRHRQHLPDQDRTRDRHRPPTGGGVHQPGPSTSWPTPPTTAAPYARRVTTKLKTAGRAPGTFTVRPRAAPSHLDEAVAEPSSQTSLRQASRPSLH
jgi:hypothetical protein